MKKLFSIFFVLALLWSGNVWAQDEEISSLEANPTKSEAQIHGRRNATQDTYPIWTSNLSYIKAVQTSSGVFTITVHRYRSSNNDYPAVFKAVGVSMSADNIRGTWYFESNKKNTCSEGNNYLVDKDGDYAENPYGNMTFTFQNRYNGDGEPIYNINMPSVTAAQSYNGSCYYFYAAAFSQTLPVRAYASNGTTPIQLINAVYTISANVSPSGAGTVTIPNSGQVADKRSITITANNSNAGYVFSHWEDDSSNTNPERTITNVLSNATYTAVFIPAAATQYTINTAVNNNALGSVTTGGEKYENTIFNISATINDPANYYLSDWLRDGVSMGVRTNPLPITVTKAETYTAVITAKEWTLTVNSDNTSLGTVSGGKKCYDGETTTITATPANSFSSFVKWQKNGVDYAGGASINVTVNANDTYTAFFSGRNIIEVDIPNATYVDRWSIYSLRGNSNGTSSENNGYYVDVACNTSNNALSSVDGIKYNGSTMSFTTKTIESIEQPCGNRKITNLACYNATGDVYMFKIHWTQPWGEDSNDTYPNDRTINANQQAAYDDDLGAIYVYGYTKEYEWNGQATLRAMGMYFVTGQRCSDDIKIPVGTYEINCSGDPGTVMSYQSGMDKDLSGGWAQTQGVEHGYYLLDKGTVTVTKSGSTYTINVNAKNSYGNDLISTMTIDESVITGTIPNYTLNVTTDGHGTATVKRYDCSGNLNAVSNSGSFKQGSYFQLEASPSSGYAFDYWTIDGVDEHFTNNPETLDGLYSNATVTAHFRTAINYEVTITSPTNGTVTISYNDGSAQSFTSGSREIAEGTTLTVTTTPANGYQFSAWTNDGAASVTVDDTKTIGATFAPILYAITYNGLEGATNAGNPTSYNVETETITLAYPGTRDGYIFAGWKDESDNTITQITQGSTGNRTLTATWNVKSSDITLCENCNNAHYNTFKANYNNETVNVTYNRQFAEGRWSTMCLPFSLDLATMIANKMYGRVYEFKYATGNANTNSGVNLYFSNAKSIEAGTCYIVNANDALAAKTSFVFSGVTIDLSKDNGAALDSKDDYDDLPGYKSQGTIELVGTLRNGTLKGSDTGNTYMGLKSNKIYYPNTGTGSTIWAYRGIFRSTSALNVEKMRIVVDGEDKGEIRIDNGELIIDNGSPVRKFIRNGNLYIEREGVIYDAQGKRVE